MDSLQDMYEIMGSADGKVPSHVLKTSADIYQTTFLAKTMGQTISLKLDGSSTQTMKNVCYPSTSWQSQTANSNASVFDPLSQDEQLNESTLTFKLRSTCDNSPEPEFWQNIVRPGSTLSPPLFKSPQEKDPEGLEVHFSDWLDLTDAPDSSDVYAPVPTCLSLSDPEVNGYDAPESTGLTAAEVRADISAYHGSLVLSDADVLDTLGYHQPYLTYPTYSEEYTEDFLSRIDPAFRPREQDLLTFEHLIAVDYQHRLEIIQQNQFAQEWSNGQFPLFLARTI